jgi:hypothetical protein
MYRDCSNELEAAQQVDAWVADALERGLINTTEAFKMRNLPAHPGAPVRPRSAVPGVSYAPIGREYSPWRFHWHDKFDGHYPTQQEAELVALAFHAQRKAAAEGGEVRPHQLSVEQQVGLLLHALRPQVEASLERVQRAPPRQRMREVRPRQAAEDELVPSEVEVRYNSSLIASLMRRFGCYQCRHELNSVVRAGVLRQPSPPLLHLLLGLDWDEAVVYVLRIGGALGIRFPYCHLDHGPPMALEDGSAPADKTTSVAQVTPCNA